MHAEMNALGAQIHRDTIEGTLSWGAVFAGAVASAALSLTDVPLVIVFRSRK